MRGAEKWAANLMQKLTSGGADLPFPAFLVATLIGLVTQIELGCVAVTVGVVPKAPPHDRVLKGCTGREGGRQMVNRGARENCDTGELTGTVRPKVVGTSAAASSGGGREGGPPFSPTEGCRAEPRGGESMIMIQVGGSWAGCGPPQRRYDCVPVARGARSMPAGMPPHPPHANPPSAQSE